MEQRQDEERFLWSNQTIRRRCAGHSQQSNVPIPDFRRYRVFLRIRQALLAPAEGSRVDRNHRTASRGRLRQAVGDALGVPYEFQDRDSFACANMIGHGTHNQPAGTWSDDTSMMLATLDSLIGNDWQVDIEDMQHRFNAWLYDANMPSTETCSTAETP